MTQTITPQANVKVKAPTGKSRSGSGSRSHSKQRDPQTDERKLDQHINRSQQDIEQLVDEIICTGEQIVGGVQDALDDLMGYDTEYAQFLLHRDAEERKRQEEEEKRLKAETPLQRQQRLAREARMSKRGQVRNELYRDDRTPIQKIRDTIKNFSYRKTCKKLDQYGLLMRPWQVGTLACLMFMMIATNISVFGKGVEIQAAPSSYSAFCTSCDNHYQIPRTQFEEYSFYDVHPKDFQLQYGKKHPQFPACPKCNVVHQKLILISRPDRDERFLLATNPYFQMPIDQKGMEDLCNKYQ